MLHALRLVQLQQTQPQLLPPPPPVFTAALRPAARRCSASLAPPAVRDESGPAPAATRAGRRRDRDRDANPGGPAPGGRGRLACRLGLRAARRASMAVTLDLLPMRACRARSLSRPPASACAEARPRLRCAAPATALRHRRLGRRSSRGQERRRDMDCGARAPPQAGSQRTHAAGRSRSSDAGEAAHRQAQRDGHPR